MGALKLTYYDKERALEKSSFFVVGGVEKNALEQKKGLDYYSFGSQMPQRNFTSSEYDYGMNGQEKDDEITGVAGAHTTAMFWEYDTRLGRRWNVDPVNKPFESSYAAFGGNPIMNVDPNGDDWYKAADGSQKWHDNTSDGFSDLDGMSWTRLGETLNSTTATGGSTQATFVLDVMDYATRGFQDKWTRNGTANSDGSFTVNDDFPVDDFFTFMVGSFVTGKGSDDYIFGPKSLVSADLSKSLMFAEAVALFKENSYKNGFSPEIKRKPNNPMDLYKEWVVEPKRAGYIATVTHVLGSANFHFENYSKNGQSWTRITVSNKHTVASATGTNAPYIGFIMGGEYRYPRPNSSVPQPFTNINQTIIIEKPTNQL
jgi:hypothetical protein